MPTPPAIHSERPWFSVNKIYYFEYITVPESCIGQLQQKLYIYIVGPGTVCVPRVRALTKIMDAKMKMMRDARPSQAISFLTKCCPVMAATNATPVK